jgi:RNA polymerase sigma factor (TIGR02999 family)
MAKPQDDITELLRLWNEGDPDAFDKLAPLVYRDLHRLAVRYMRNERPGHTLQPTGLINEAYVRLHDWRNVRWQNRSHFFAVSAQFMRRVLVDYARSRLYAKRGGDVATMPLDESEAVCDERSTTVLDVDLALQRLAAIDPHRAQVVELRYFGGLSVEETAEVMQVSPITVTRCWNFAKAWLLRELTASKRNGPSSAD